MYLLKTSNSSARQSKKQMRTKKNNENLHQIVIAQKKYMESEHVHAEMYSEQEYFCKVLQKRFFYLCSWPKLEPREFVSVKILAGKSPREIFFMKKTDEQAADQFNKWLSDAYDSENYQNLYFLKAGIICVANSKRGWRRCRILKLYKNSTCDVLLIDSGQMERIEWRDLRIASKELVDEKPFAIKCTLVDVGTALPIERFTIFQQNTFLQTLRQFNDFYICVNQWDATSAKVFLYYKSDNQFYCVNHIFPSTTYSDDSSRDSFDTDMKSVQNTSPMELKLFEPAEREVSLPSEPIKQNGNNDAPCQITKPESVVVRHVESIDAIYVCFGKHVKAFNRLHFEVQNAAQEDMDNPSEWAVEDYCLVQASFTGRSEWFRARIQSIKPPTKCIVYLRDFGKTMESKIWKLKAIAPKHWIVRDFAWKVKLAHLHINAVSSTIAVELLQDMIDEYTEMAFSAFGHSSGKECNVILWGVKKIANALLPETIKYENINEKLVQQGVVRSSISFYGIANLINPQQPDHDEAIAATCTIIEDLTFLNPSNGRQKYPKVTDSMADVKRWLPSEYIGQEEFVAFPMYVNKNMCIIWVLEANRKDIADEMQRILEKKHRTNELNTRDPLEWNKEDACFARFKADNHYYRATVRRVNFERNTCMVRFVDYGNCESCSLDDLRVANMFQDIPMLSRQYKLANVRPKDGSHVWPEQVRDYITQLIVAKQCNLVPLGQPFRDASMEMEMCHLKIFTKYNDLATALISRGFAEPDLESFELSDFNATSAGNVL